MLANVLTKTVRDRWKGMTIGAGSIALFLVYAMWVYQDIDLSLYTDLPETMRALMNIPAEADVGSLAYGAMYSFTAALTLAALALSMGSASIAREERNGTIGLLLGNPKSRNDVLISKAGSMVLLTGLGALVLWGAARIVPVVLNVDITGMHVGALVLHMFCNALFYGFLAMALGAWTGSSGLASGVTAGVMVVSYFAAGLFPLIEGAENVAKAFPWYYYDGGQPLNNGVQWSHIGVLLGGAGLFAVLAVVGLNRRDLRGQTVGVTLIDRLRGLPLTKRLADRLAGSARVSHLWVKTASEHQGLLLVVGISMFLMSLTIGPMYSLIDEGIRDFAEQLPEALLALAGNGDMSTAAGFYQVEIFSVMAPIAVMVVTVTIGARALAGEEANRTMGLLLANPIRRSRVVIEKTLAMVVLAVAVSAAIFAGTALGSFLGALDMSLANMIATSLLLTLLGLVVGALALALSAATGRMRVAVFGAVGVALGWYLLNSFLPLNESVAGYARWSPFYYYLTSDPLNNGMHWGHAAVLTALALVLWGLAVVLFQRRDLRQTG